MFSLEEILEKLNTEDESVDIEAKRGSDIGKSALETISAFSNEPDQDGGYLVLGVVRNSITYKYEVEGVERIDDVKNTLASVCRDSFNLPIRPHIYVETVDGKNVVIAFIAEAQPQDKPIFIKSKGVKLGAYRRITSTDQRCTDEDLLLFIQLKNRRSFDETPLPETSFEDFEPRAIQEYRRLRKETHPLAEELTYSDEELLDALGATAVHQGKRCLTVAGVILFGKSSSLRKLFPMMRIDYMRISGNEWMSDVENRYESSLEMREALVLVIPKLINQIMEDIPKKFSLSENSARRQDVPLIPFRVVREAVANALMHRDYNLHSAIQVIRYANRFELINPGYSLIADPKLGEPGASRMRNPKIASVLRDLNYAETKGTGIRTMRTMMQDANLTTPIITSDRRHNIFALTLLSIHFMEQEDIKWLEEFKDCNLTNEEARALVFVKNYGTIDNAVFRSINGGIDTLKASTSLRKLRDSSLLQQRPQGAATYYVPGSRLLKNIDTDSPQGNLFNPNKELENYTTHPVNNAINPVNNAINPVDNPTYPVDNILLVELKDTDFELAVEIENFGERGTVEEVETVILKLCNWKTLKSSEIASLIGRGQHYINTNYLRRMVRDELVEYQYPENPSHNKQAYRITAKGREFLKNKSNISGE